MREGAGYWQSAEDAAAEKNLAIVLPKANELFIDIDNAASLELFFRNIPLLGQLVKGFSRSPSPSGKAEREHVTVSLTRDLKDPVERIMLQAILGSDLVHEALSWKQMTSGVENPTVFFEKKES